MNQDELILASELILKFDADYDIPLKHDKCLGELQKAGAFAMPDRDGGSVSDWAVHVGAFWCRMVAHDVRYELGEGLQAYLESRRAHEILLDRMGRAERNAEPLIAYAAARWEDGAGKCQYRVSRYREAVRLFESAASRAERWDLWWILPDLTSNRLRATQEAERIAAGGDWNEKSIGERRAVLEGLRDQYRSALARAAATGRKHGVDMGSELVVPEGAKERWPSGWREFARGCASLYHNFSVLRILDGREKLRLSECSAAICDRLGDEYRLGQALNEQQIALREDPKTVGVARERLKRLLGGGWVRGRQIARQALAYLDGKSEKTAKAAVVAFEELLGEIDESRRRRGSDFGLDLDFPYYTVELASKVTGQLAEAEREPWRRKLASQRLANARSLKRIVTISEDKFAYSAKTVQPAYRPEIGRLVDEYRIASSKEARQRDRVEALLDELLAYVEESTSREILDLMALNRRTGKKAKEISGDFSPGAFARLEESGRRQDSRKFLRKAANPDGLEEVRKRAQQISGELMDRPIEVEEVDADVRHRLKLLAANHRDLCVVRFFLYGQANRPALAAFVIMNDREYLIADFEYAALEGLKRDLVKRATENLDSPAPDVASCRRMHELVIRPILEALRSDAGTDPKEWVIVPAGVLFELPIHVSLGVMEGPEGEESGGLLAERNPIVFAVSIQSLLREGRFFLRRQFVSDTDDLCAMIVDSNEEGFGGEIADLEWPKEHFFVATSVRPPAGVLPHRQWRPRSGRPAPTFAALRALSAVHPEFFVYSGHGDHRAERQDLPILLQIETEDHGEDYVSELDIAANVQLRHNKLTVISACVAGLGASRREGEVAGLIRSFMASGCGLLGLSLWPVLASEIERTARTLLDGALHAMKTREAVDFPARLAGYYQGRGKELGGDFQARIEACPMVLFL